MPRLSPSAICSGPIAMACDGNGNLFLVQGNSIREYTTSGVLVNASLASGLANPQAIALDGNGHIFVANFDGTIGEYTTTGVTVNAALTTGLYKPLGIAVEFHAMKIQTNDGGFGVRTNQFGFNITGTSGLVI